MRASFGLFYEPSPTNLWYNAFISSGGTQAYNAAILSSSPLAPRFPDVITFSPGSAPLASTDIITVTPNYKNAYTINSSVQISQQLSHNDALTVGYVNTGARDLEFLRNINPINPISFLPDGRPVYSGTASAATRLFPQFGNITLQDVGAITDYKAMIVNYTRRLAQGFQVSASYTWSHSISDAPDANSFEQNTYIEDNTSRLRDRSNSAVNRPQALTMSWYIAPKVDSANRAWKWLANKNELAILGNLSSGDQQNITANKNLNGDAKAVTRPLFIGRNTLRGPNIYQVDARYTRTFLTIKERLRPKFIAEFNNVFNKENITALNAVVPVDATGAAILPTFFQPLSTVLEKRIVQFGIRLDW